MSTRSETPPPAKPKRSPGSKPGASSLPRFDIRDLLGEGREAILVHGEDQYRLRVTVNNKLILTK